MAADTKTVGVAAVSVAAAALILWNEYIVLSLLSNRPLRFSGDEHREKRPEDGEKR